MEQSVEMRKSRDLPYTFFPASAIIKGGKGTAEGKGAASLDGKMIDIAMYRMGLETIAKAEGIEKKAGQRKEET